MNRRELVKSAIAVPVATNMTFAGDAPERIYQITLDYKPWDDGAGGGASFTSVTSDQLKRIQRILWEPRD